MTTFADRPDTALLVIDAQKSAHDRDAVARADRRRHPRRTAGTIGTTDVDFAGDQGATP